MEIYSAETITETFGTYLIYGSPGKGKTTALKYLPGKTLVLDIDRTSKVLRGCSNIDIAEIDNIDTFSSWTSAISELISSYKGKYDNIAVDNISELERCILSALGRLGKNHGVPSQADYQYMQIKLVNSLRYLKTMGANIILTAWETTELYTDSSGVQYNTSFPQINRKIVNNVCGLCDVVARIIVKDENSRGFIMTATNSVYAKNQLDDRKGCPQEQLILCTTNNSMAGDENEATPISA